MPCTQEQIDAREVEMHYASWTWRATCRGVEYHCTSAAWVTTCRPVADVAE